MRALPLVALLTAAGVSSAQDAAVFRAGVELVRVDVQVTDRGRAVDDLQAADFVLLDEGAPQAIQYFAHDEEPLWIVLLLDVSSSMKKMLEQMSETAEKALALLKPEDRVAVMLFARTTLVHQDFTVDREKAAGAIWDAQYERRPGNSTDINSAVVQAAEYLRRETQGRPGRRAVVILTDNRSMSYRIPNQAVLRALYSADAVLEAIVTEKAEPPEPPKDGIEVNPDFTPADVFLLAQETGGEVLKVNKAGKALQDVMERLRTRYSLHYRPPDGPPGSFRRVTIDLTPDARRNRRRAQVRARTGYYLPE